MGNFVLSSDSCCDIPGPLLTARKIRCKPLTFITDMDGKLEECLDNFIGDEERVKKFYNDVRGGMMAKTSQLTMHDHIEYFKQILEAEHKDVVHITLSSGLSGTYDQAVLAAKKLKEEYPDVTVHVVDSLGATVGQRHLVDKAERLRDSGASAQETAAELREATKRLHHWIMIDDLNHLKRGGRISGAAAAVGTLLNIKPFLGINHEGRLVILDKIRGYKKSLSRIVKMVEKYGGEQLTGGKVYVVHTDNLELAKELDAAIRAAVNVDTEIVMMGPVIGAHFGPGGVAASFIGKERITDF